MRTRVSLWDRLRKLADTEGWRREQAERWAARFFAGPKQRVAGRVVRILTDYELVGMGIEQMTPSIRFGEDLRMNEDFLVPVGFVMALEEEFGLEIPDEDAAGFRTLEALISYVHARLEKDSA